jgi:hypothetical protein
MDAPGGKAKVTIVSGTAALVVGTSDGSLPVLPSAGTEVPGGQKAIPAVLGAYMTLAAPLFGDHMAKATIQLRSTGNPTVLVEW